MKPAKDLFSGHAGDYARFRPAYPRQLYRTILGYVQARDTAWDAGTGSGQVAVGLSRYFSRVTGTDISANQLGQAPLRENIIWKVARAEDSGLADGYADLITVGQALHWFDIPGFSKEVIRVLRPGGILACFGYGLIQGPDKVNPVIKTFYRETLGNYWPPERRWIEQAYDGIGIPFTESFELNYPVTWKMDDLLGYLSTWSAVKAYVRDTGTDPFIQLKEELNDTFTEPARFSFPVFLKIWQPEQDSLKLS